MESNAKKEEHGCVWVCVCGPPACGKTTLCRAIVAAHAPNMTVAHVEFDAILRARTAANGGTLTHALWRECRTALLDAADAAATHLLAHSPPPTRGIVLLDDNFPLASMRLAVARRAALRGAAFATLWLAQDPAVAAARNTCRTPTIRVAPAVAARLTRTAEAPRPARHTWERVWLRIDAAATPLATDQAQHAITWLAAVPLDPVVLVDPVKAEMDERHNRSEQQPDSVVFDLWMRRTVGAVLAATAPAKRPVVARRVAELRRAAVRPGCSSSGRVSTSVAQAQTAFISALKDAGVLPEEEEEDAAAAVVVAQLMAPVGGGDGDGEGEGGGDGSDDEGGDDGWTSAS